MSARVTALSGQRNGAHEFRVYREGAIVGTVAATAVVGQDYVYFADMPASIGGAGHYVYQLLRTSDFRQRAGGEFYWDGTDIVHPEEQVPLTQPQVQTASESALTAYGAAKEASLATSSAAIIAAIAGLNDVSAAELEAALLDDGDGTAFREGLAATVEAALANEADGSATIAVFQGAVAAALTAYNTAKQSDVDGLNDVSQADVQSAVETALTTYDGATSDELAAGVASLAAQSLANKGLTVAQEQTLEFIRNVSEADEVYTPTKAQKILKGTSTVLVDKDVTSSTECEVNTSLIEAP